MTDSPIAPLYALQRDPRRRWIATLLAALVGLALASVHWVGLFLGGALVGWAWPTLGRAVLAGLGFGLLALGSFAVVLAEANALDAATATGQIVLVAVATALVLGPLGGLSRGLAPNAPAEGDPVETEPEGRDPDTPAQTHSD